MLFLYEARPYKSRGHEYVHFERNHSIITILETTSVPRHPEIPETTTNPPKSLTRTYISIKALSHSLCHTMHSIIPSIVRMSCINFILEAGIQTRFYLDAAIQYLEYIPSFTLLQILGVKNNEALSCPLVLICLVFLVFLRRGERLFVLDRKGY